MSLLWLLVYGFFSAGLRLRGRHALFPPKGEEKKAKVEQVRHALRNVAGDAWCKGRSERRIEDFRVLFAG
jgi:hypothetical protein